MSCEVGEATEGLENELCSFSNLFCHFTYVTAHSPTLPLLHLRHSSIPNPSFASPTSQGLHLRHLASRPCSILLVLRLSFLFFSYSPLLETFEKYYGVIRLERYKVK